MGMERVIPDKVTVTFCGADLCEPQSDCCITVDWGEGRTEKDFQASPVGWLITAMHNTLKHLAAQNGGHYDQTSQH